MSRKREKIHITTLGCEKNLVDSEAMAGYLDKKHFAVTEDPEDADTIIINTCGFIKPAKEESIDAILEAVELKKEGKVKKVLVAGCMAARYMKQLKPELPEVDAFFGTEDYRNIAEYLGQTHSESIDKIYSRRDLSGPTHFGYIKISEGCSHRCSFCAIPIMRGRHRSRTIEDILSEAEMLVSRGAKELILIAQDSTYWGKDLKEELNILHLLAELEKNPSLQWLRVMYLFPNTIPDGYFEYMRDSEKLLHYVDIPLQHASTGMLKKMRRGGTRKSLEKLITGIRDTVEDIVIRTTFIVGHPGETEADFEELLDFVEKMEFNRVGAFVYSDEEGTFSYRQEEKVPEGVASTRYDLLMEKQSDISLTHNEKWIGREIDIIVDDYIEDRKTLVGRSYGDAPEIDNEVLIEGVDEGQHYTGKIIRVKISDAGFYELFGKIIY